MSNLHFRKYIIDNVLKGVSEQVKYDLVCKIDQIARGEINGEDTKSIGINILLRTSFSGVEVMQCVPFYLTVTAKTSDASKTFNKYFFSIGQIATIPQLIHISMFETTKMDLDLHIEHLENSGYFDNESGNTPNVNSKRVIRLSNIEFTFHNSLKECIVYINGARVICVKYGAALKRFVSHFINGLIEAITLGVKELETKI